MIIQIDHLALSTDNIEKDTQFLNSLGYQNKFCEKNLKNPEIKKSFLKFFSSTHSLSLFAKNGSLNIELIDHHNINQQDGFIAPVSINALDEFIVKTKNIKKSIRFWQCFGFKVLDSESDSAILEFTSLLQKAPCRIILQEGHPDRKYFLDDRGFSCLAFLSTAVKDDTRILKDKGFVVTETEQFKVNNRMLDICFVIGPGGELAEIISISK